MIIQVEISDENYQKVVDSICLTRHYQELVDDGSGLNVMIENPQTKDEFVVETIKKMMSESIMLADSMVQRSVVL